MDITTNPQKTILLVTDTKESSNRLLPFLLGQAFNIVCITLRGKITPLLSRENPDLVLVNIIASETDALRTCREIRSAYYGPIVLVTDRYSEMYHIQVLSCGADDLFSTSFNSLLFLAKLNALLTKSDRVRTNTKNVIRFNGLTVDTSRRDVIIQGKNIPLTSIEFDIFTYLIKNAGRVVSRNDVHIALYNSEHNGYDRSIDSYVSRIRRKIGDDSIEPKYLKTVRGEGYLFVGIRDKE
jgi:two-component system, OmpR family, response regulator RstA